MNKRFFRGLVFCSHTRHIYVRGFNELFDPEQQYVVAPAEHYFVHMTLGSFSDFFQMVPGGYSEYTGTLRFGTSEDLPPIDHGSQSQSDEEHDSDEVAMMQHGGVIKNGKQDLVDGDEVGWMQQPAHSSSTPPQTIQLVGLHGASAVVTIDPMRTIMSQLSDIWPFTYRVAEDVSELIAMSNPPSAPGVDETIHVDMYIMCLLMTILSKSTRMTFYCSPRLSSKAQHGGHTTNKKFLGGQVVPVDCKSCISFVSTGFVKGLV